MVVQKLQVLYDELYGSRSALVTWALSAGRHSMLTVLRGSTRRYCLRYGEVAQSEPGQSSDSDGGQEPDEGVRQPDPGSLPAVAPGTSETSPAELLPGSMDADGSGNEGSGSVSPNPLIGSRVIREAVREEIQAYWSAPLPPPETLEHYNQIVPGMAERILAMTERSVTGKLDIEDKLAIAEIETAKIGLSLAFALTLLAFVASVVFFALGNDIAGGAFLSFPVFMLIRSFIVRSGKSDTPND